MTVELIYNNPTNPSDLLSYPSNLVKLDHSFNSIIAHSVLGLSSAIEFYLKGCSLLNGNYNCFTACRNITQVMGNYERLNDCLAYLRISQAMAADQLTYDDSNALKVAD